MSEGQAEISRKVKRASQLLFFQRHRKPGVKGWELRKALGPDFMKIIDILNSELDKLNLQVKVVFEEAEAPHEPSEEQVGRARFFITIKKPLAVSDVISSGWRIDDIAALAATIALVISRQGKMARKDVEQILREKFPKWRVDLNLDRFIKNGYLLQDEQDMLHIGWRTRAEIDQKTLMNLILSK
ncbi:MAG: hypothetical protein L6N95_00140 [Candidatus Methylarchaceae archaeon HK01B]|nr:hypothetical protein [Candidatus Methylarchaceae archaeon HK01M]MCP8311571.1 hypothetical protein [Candidatus Methylarchaceae archaeon HK02M1]MCP8318220.1 hypothetical protein [Candidatus Methylarchaceae archaeon HK01B]